MKNKLFNQIHLEVGVTPFTQMLNYGYPSKEMERLLKMRPIDFAGLYQNETVKLFCDIHYWAKAAQVITKRAFTQSKFFNKLVRDSDKIKKQTIALLHQYGKSDLSQINNRQLAADLKILAYNAFLLSVNSQLAQIADISHNIFSSTLEEVIQSSPGYKKTKLTAGKIFNILTTSVKHLPSDQAQAELRLLKNKLRKRPQQKQAIINQYLSRWFWLNFGHLGPATTKAQVVSQIKHPQPPKKIKSLTNKQAKLERQLSLTPKQRQLFKVARLFVYLKGMREQVCNGIYAFLNHLAEKIQAETGVPKKYLMYLSIQECLNYLENKKLPPKSILRQRRQFSIWIPKDVFTTKIFTGHQAKVYLKNHLNFKKEKISASSKISGRVAYPGKVVGRVRIINKVSEINKIKKGEIMVSIQTMPELLPAMKKAAAFVTDIGGITSHAAIVAREMKKPCVIGIKIATRVLKDGDKVFVDANRGDVKKI